MIVFNALNTDEIAAIRDAAASRIADLNVEAATARDAGPAVQLIVAETIDHLAGIYRAARDLHGERVAMADLDAKLGVEPQNDEHGRAVPTS